MGEMTIGELARRAGVGTQTVRFYERLGLLDEPPRTRSGYRQYPDATLDRVRFIRRAKTVGFTLKEIEDLLDLAASPGNPCGEILQRAEEKADEIGGRIRELRQIRRGLLRLAAACREEHPDDACAFLDALFAGEREE